jgi:hypothetical protein
MDEVLECPLSAVRPHSRALESCQFLSKSRNLVPVILVPCLRSRWHLVDSARRERGVCMAGEQGLTSVLTQDDPSQQPAKKNVYKKGNPLLPPFHHAMRVEQRVCACGTLLVLWRKKSNSILEPTAPPTTEHREQAVHTERIQANMSLRSALSSFDEFHKTQQHTRRDQTARSRVGRAEPTVL